LGLLGKITLDNAAEGGVAVANGLMLLVILIMGKRENGAEAVMAVIVKIHAREPAITEIIRGGVAELGHQAATGPVEGYCLMILAAGMFVQDLETVVEVAYLFEAYIVHGAFQHPVKGGAGVFSHPPRVISAGRSSVSAVRLAGCSCCSTMRISRSS
jgi:hypothetical protein